MARNLSSDYLAGELEERQRSAIRGHLRQCDECRQAYDDEADLVEAAHSLDSVEPPASLWEGIATRLADEEVADAERSQVWFWWRGFWNRYRLHAAGAAAAAAVVITLVASGGGTTPSEVAGASAVAQLDESEAAAAAVDYHQAVGAELARADSRYTGTIDELEGLIAEERARWDDARRTRYDTRLAELDRAIATHRQSGLAELDVFARDELYGAYRAKIDFMSDAALGEVP